MKRYLIYEGITVPASDQAEDSVCWVPAADVARLEAENAKILEALKRIYRLLDMHEDDEAMAASEIAEWAIKKVMK